MDPHLSSSKLPLITFGVFTFKYGNMKYPLFHNISFAIFEKKNYLSLLSVETRMKIEDGALA